MPNRQDLERESIGSLRKLAEQQGLTTRKKADIVAALADDYRIGSAPSLVLPEQLPRPPIDDAEDMRWPEVPMATADVNGGYVEPPWFAEMMAAALDGHVELQGPAGSGKTLAVHVLAKNQGKRLAVITADGGLRKRDLVGQRELIGGSTIFQVAEFAAAARNGDWALIDEANLAEADALGFLNGMTDRPGQVGSTFAIAGKAVEVHPEFRCFLTRNPGYQGTKSMNEALRDRFWSIEVPPLLGDSLRQMLVAHGVGDAYIDDGVAIVGALFSAWERNRVSYQISPRRVLAAAKMARQLGDFRALLRKSILTKVEAKHDRDAVATVLDLSFEGLTTIKQGGRRS